MDFIDYNEWFKSKQKKNKLLYTKFDRLLKKRDDFYRKWLWEAYILAKGNISLISRQIGMSYQTLKDYYRKIYGENFREVLNNGKS